MKRFLVVFLSLILATPAGASRLVVSHKVMEMTRGVAVCETGMANEHGPRFYGRIGWRPATWVAFRRPDFPSRMDWATWKQQAWAMARFAAVYGWPDQSGCTGGY